MKDAEQQLRNLWRVYTQQSAPIGRMKLTDESIEIKKQIKNGYNSLAGWMNKIKFFSTEMIFKIKICRVLRKLESVRICSFTQFEKNKSKSAYKIEN